MIGEFHDNPHHHDVQAEALRQMSPKAVVYEMLTPQEAQHLGGVARTPQAMRVAVDGQVQWSNIEDYAEVLAESPVMMGAALPRDTVRAAFHAGAAQVFGEDAAAFGLDGPLLQSELDRRKQLQFEAHCQAMPLEMMGGMVEAQRLRDAAFARTVLEAVDNYGTPVVLITGNGHARSDWGVPAALAMARPGLTVLSVAQGEEGRPPQGEFDTILTSPPAVRSGDPCAAFD
ncbi:ChaN family lipoprotein [Aliishimia ponticola]|uniref:ChaN family lipoprotein n=1 Tax=Aliishimia ponticola TaxID=2499833 RepID=UPI0014560AF6